MKARVDINLGKVFCYQDKAEEGCLYYYDALENGKYLGNKQIEADAYAGLACVSQSTSDYHSAVTNHKKCLGLAEELNDKERQQEAHGNLGHAYFALEEWSEAIRSYQSSCDIAKHCQDTEAVYRCENNMGRAYYKMEDYNNAVMHLRRCLEIEVPMNDNAQLYRVIGYCYLNTDQPQSALEFYEKYLEAVNSIMSKTEVATVRLEAGKLYEEYGDYERAIQLYEQCLNDLDYVELKQEVHERLGDMYCRKSRYDDAREQYCKIPLQLANRDKQLQIHYKIGKAFFSLKKFPEAIQHYYEALGDVKNAAMNADIYKDLGVASLIEKDYKNAISYYLQSLEFANIVNDDKRRQRAYESLGDAHRETKQWSQAISHYDRSLDVAKRLDDKKGLQGRCETKMGLTYYEAEEYKKAIEFLEKANDGTVAEEIYLFLGRAYAKVGQYEKAEKYLGKDLRNAKDRCDMRRQARVQGYIGRVYVKTGKFQDAFDCYHKAHDIAQQLEDKAEEAEVYCNLGCAFQASHQFKDAIENHKKFLQLSEKLDNKRAQARAHKKLGNIYYATGEHASAIKSYNACLATLENTDQSTTVRVFSKLCRIWRSIGKLEMAIDYHKSQADNAVAPKDIARASENLCIDYELNGDYDKALDLQEKYFEAAEQLGTQAQGQAHVNIARVHLAKGEYKEAVTKAKIAEELDNTAVKARAYGVMGCAYTGLGQYETAKDMHGKEMCVMDANDKSANAQAKGYIGIAHLGKGDYKDAIVSFQEQKKFVQKIKNKKEEGRMNENFGNYYAAIGECKQAIPYNEKFLKIAEEDGDKAAIGRAKSCIGTNFTEMGQYQDALKCHEEEIKIAKNLKNKVREGQALGNLGNVYTNLCVYQRAIELHKESLKIAEEHDVQIDQRRANANLGNAYMASGQYREAINSLNRALEIAQQLGQRAAEGRIHENIAKAYYLLGEFEKAVESSEKSLSIARNVGDKAGEGRALGTLGSAYMEFGKSQQASFALREYLKITKQLSNEADEADALRSLAAVYVEIGQHEKALKCCKESLKIAKKLKDKAREGKSYGNFGKLYMAVGKYPVAVENHKKHLEIATELDDKVEIGRSNGNLGDAYSKTGEHAKAIKCQTIDERIAMELGNRARVGRAQGNMGNTYTATGQFERAIKCNNARLTIAEELGDKASLAQALLGLGLNYVNSGQFKVAEETLKRLYEISRPISTELTAIVQESLGQCYRENDVFNACSFFAKSIVNFQTIRNSVRDHDDFNISMSNRFANVHKLLFQSLLDLKEKETALLVSDLGKAQALFDLRRDVRGVDSYVNLSDPFEAIAADPSSASSRNLLKKSLFNVINNRQADTVISYAFGDNGELHTWVMSREGVFHHKLLKSESSMRSYLNRQIYHLKGKLDVATLTKRADVNEEEDIESATGNSFLFMSHNIESNEEADYLASIHTLVDEQDPPNNTALVVTRKPGACAKSCAKADQTAHNSYLHNLYVTLIQPIEQHLTGSKLLIVPEGILWTLPFAALLDASEGHLCDKYSLQFIPSLHLLNFCLSTQPGVEIGPGAEFKPGAKLGPALFVGNPKLPNHKPLVFAEKEATTCSKFFNAQPVLGHKATKKNVLTRMARASIIHIAAHGRMERGEILLTPNEGEPLTASSHLLTAEDILKYPLCARLVVLSCCYSGNGEISPEGVVGTARSSLGSGARAVLVALWQINDKGAMEFMVEFYEKLVQEYSVCTAMQQAMISLKKRYQPNVWAPFLVIGEDIKLTKGVIEIIRQRSDLR